MHKIILLLIFIIFSQSDSFAQEEKKISKEKKEQIYNKINFLIDEYYVFPRKADTIIKDLSKVFNSKQYTSINDYQIFVNQLNNDIRLISEDYHFALNFTSSNNVTKKERKSSWSNYQKFHNYGFLKLEILEGNIAYLKLDFFAKPNRKILKTVFNFIKNTNGIIIDLRDNNGGMRKMVGLMTSYFIDGSEKIATIETKNKQIKTIKTSRFIKKGRMTEIPLTILVSKESFSSAEFFAYTLQKLERAKIIGEPTGGGAHSIKRFQVIDSLMLAVPNENVISSITNTNWEKTGITPDIKAGYNDSFIIGYIETLKALKANGLPSETDFYNKIIDKLFKEYHLIQQKNKSP